MRLSSETKMRLSSETKMRLSSETKMCFFVCSRRNKEADRKATEAFDGARLKRSNKLFELRRSPSKNDKL